MKQAEQIARLKADSIRKRERMRQEFPAAAAWIDECRATFPGSAFKHWTCDGKPI